MCYRITNSWLYCIAFWPLFTMKNLFCDFLLPSLGGVAFYNGSKVSPKGVNSFLQESISTETGGKKKMAELLALKVYIHVHPYT